MTLITPVVPETRHAPDPSPANPPRQSACSKHGTNRSNTASVGRTGEYGDLDCDYVFVNLFAAPRGQAMTYSAACDLVVRLRARVGFDFDPHWLRHCMATRALRDGVPLEVVSKLLGHSSTTVTEQVYGHLTVEDARKALEAAGWFSSDGAEVAL